MELFYDKNKEYEDSFRRLWKTCFHDPQAYEDFYFQSTYSRNKVLAAAEDGAIRGMIHLNPYLLKVGDVKRKLHYIVGVATDPKFRRQGIMREMLTKVMQDMADAGEVFTYLMPADVSYYEPFNFVKVSGFEEVEMYGEEGESHIQPLMFKDYVKATKFANDYYDNRYKVYTMATQDVLFFMRWEALSENGKLLCLKHDDEIAGLAVYGIADDTVYVRQILGDRDEMIRELKAYFGNQRMLVTLPNDEKDDAQIMMRMLRLDLYVAQCKAKRDFDLTIFIKDDYLENQNGYFRIFTKDGYGCIERVEEPEEPVDTFTITEVTKLILRHTDMLPWMIGEIV